MRVSPVPILRSFGAGYVADQLKYFGGDGICTIELPKLAAGTMAAARAEGVALPLTALVDQLFGAARWGGFGGDDHSVVVRVIECLSGEPGDR